MIWSIRNQGCIERWIYRGAIVEVVDRLEYVRPRAFGNVAKQVADRGFSIRANMVHVFLYRLQAVIIHDCIRQLSVRVVLVARRTQPTLLDKLDALMVRRNLL